MSSLAPTIYTPAFELKGSLLTLIVLRLLELDNDKITAQFAEKVAIAPNLFQQAPVVIDLYSVREGSIDLPYLIDLLRTHHLIPVAVRGGNETHNALAITMGLGILSENKSGERARRPPEPEPVIVPPPAPTFSPAKVITQPIRSGQQVVARSGDLIVLASVSHGAEILAQGHIHVYGALRGRALAGVNSNQEARIFCQFLDAELVSIAGNYQINEDLPEQVRGKPAQVYLEGEQLKIEPL